MPKSGEDDIVGKKRKARKMLNKWARKVELSLRRTKSSDLGQNSKLLVDWSKKLRSLDLPYFQTKQPRLRELLERSTRRLDSEAAKELDLVLKHKKGTAIRRRKIISVVYFIITYLIPVAENTDIELRSASSYLLMRKFLTEMAIDANKIDEEQTKAILNLITKFTENGASFSQRLIRAFQTALIGKTASKRIQEALEKGEGERVEFKSQYPDDASELAKVIASFATSKGGMIFLGVNDKGDIIGLGNPKSTIDELSNRISNLARKAIDPPVDVHVSFWEVQSKTFAVIDVPKGPEPVYFVNGNPYIRVLTSSCKANAYQVKELHRHYFRRRNDSIA